MAATDTCMSVLRRPEAASADARSTMTRIFFLSEATVKTHLAHITQKLGLVTGCRRW